MTPPLRIGLGAASVLLCVPLGACAPAGVAGPDTVTSSRSAVSSSLPQVDNDTCPASFAQSPQLASNVSGLAGTLEPLAATRLLVCGYGIPTEMPTHPVQVRLLRAEVLTNRAGIEAIRRALNDAPPVPGCVNCPAGVVQSDQLLIFADDSSVVTVHVHIDGQSYATNGARTRTVSDSYYYALEDLVTGYPWCRPYPDCRRPYLGPSASQPPRSPSPDS